MFICGEPLSGNIGHLSVKVCKVATELCKVFGIIPSQTELAGNLMCLRQGQLSVTHYTTDFRNWASQSGWNLAAQIDTIMHRLLDYINWYHTRFHLHSTTLWS